MGWGPSAAPAPDTRAINQAAADQAALAREQYADFKANFEPALLDQMRQQTDQGKRFTDFAISSGQRQQEQADKYDKRFWGVQVPLQDQIISDAKGFDSNSYREQLANDAAGDVEQSYGVQRGQMDRDLAASGVDPSSGNAMAMRRQSGNEEAATRALAMNKTRQAATQMGWARKMDAASLNAGLPGFSSNASQLAMGWNGQGATTSGMGLNAAVSASGAQSNGYGRAMQGYQGAGQTYGLATDISSRAAQANANNQSGMYGALIGGAATIGGAMMMNPAIMGAGATMMAGSRR